MSAMNIQSCNQSWLLTFYFIVFLCFRPGSLFRLIKPRAALSAPNQNKRAHMSPNPQLSPHYHDRTM